MPYEDIGKRRERQRRYYYRNHARILEMDSAKRKRNKSRIRQQSKNYYHNGNGFKTTKKARWKYIGIVNPDGSDFDHCHYDKMFEEQQGRCGICERHQSEVGHTLGVDHDHQTGYPRALLCSGCNLRLGVIEAHEFTMKAREYLERHKN